MIRSAEAPARPRVQGILVHRMERLRNALEAKLLLDMKEHALSRFVFMDDGELDAVRVAGRPLTKRERRVIRAFEMSKKEAPVALQYAHERLVNAQRAQQEQKSLSINVERAIIRVPDTKADDVLDAVILEGDVAPR